MRDYAKYATRILFFVGVAILIIIGFNLIRNILNGGSEQDKREAVRSINLVEEGKSGKSVRYTIIGSVVGDEEHRSVRITIDPDKRVAEVLQGYENKVINTQQTSNNESAYEAFIAAINGAGFIKSVDGRGRGIEAESCPLGRKFVYELAPDSSDTFRTWSTSCGERQGTFIGTHQTIETLFRKQIPNYNNFVKDVKFSGYTNN